MESEIRGQTFPIFGVSDKWSFLNESFSKDKTCIKWVKNEFILIKTNVEKTESSIVCIFRNSGDIPFLNMFKFRVVVLI